VCASRRAGVDPLRLRPREEIRTPLIALLFWQGRMWWQRKNLWRALVQLRTTCRGSTGRRKPAVAQIQVGEGKRYCPRPAILDAGIHVDLCWRDAGGFRDNVWFQAGEGPFKEPGMIWLNSGTWEIDTASTRAVSTIHRLDHARGCSSSCGWTGTGGRPEFNGSAKSS